MTSTGEAVVGARVVGATVTGASVSGSGSGSNIVFEMIGTGAFVEGAAVTGASVAGASVDGTGVSHVALQGTKNVYQIAVFGEPSVGKPAQEPACCISAGSEAALIVAGPFKLSPSNIT
jgi:hypothetical protein